MIQLEINILKNMPIVVIIGYVQLNVHILLFFSENSGIQ